LGELAARFPDRVAVRTGMDEALAHRLIAGADLFLMPSRYEPCGLNQMYSQRYGTVPVVHATGGLDDTVAPFDVATGGGTGFPFSPCTPGGLRAAFDRAPPVVTGRPGPASSATGCARTSRGSGRRGPTRWCTARCSRPLRPRRRELRRGRPGVAAPRDRR